MKHSMRFWPLWILYTWQWHWIHIAISSARCTLWTPYLHHFIPHHFAIWQYVLASCTSTVPILQSFYYQYLMPHLFSMWKYILVPHTVLMVQSPMISPHVISPHGSKQPHLQIEGSCRYWFVLFINFFTLLLQRYSCAKFMHISPLDLHQWCSPYIELDLICTNDVPHTLNWTWFAPMMFPIHWIGLCLNHWHKTARKMCINFAQWYLWMDRVKINELNISIATGPPLCT